MGEPILAGCRSSDKALARRTSSASMRYILRRIGLTIALVFLFPSAAAWSDLIFSRKADLGPIELSHRELYLIVDKIRDAVPASPNDSVDERINIAGHGAALELPSHFTKEELAGSPMPT
jgi:hypothetical protein